MQGFDLSKETVHLEIRTIGVKVFRCIHGDFSNHSHSQLDRCTNPRV